jgi:hypothetical protein
MLRIDWPWLVSKPAASTLKDVKERDGQEPDESVSKPRRHSNIPVGRGCCHMRVLHR